MREGASPATGPQRLLVELEGHPFLEILAQPSLGVGPPAEVIRALAVLPDGRGGSCAARSQGAQIPGPGFRSSRDAGGWRGVQTSPRARRARP